MPNSFQTRVFVNRSSCPQELQRPTYSIEQFTPLKKLGGGYLSQVFCVRDEVSSRTLCLKLINKKEMTDVMRRQMVREVELQSMLDHAGCVHLYAVFEDEEQISLLMEYIPGHDLFREIRRRGKFSEGSARPVLLRILQTLDHMHGLGIIHRDLKPENILINADGSPKICDFGLSINTAKERPQTRVGTLLFLAPEILLSPDGVEPPYCPAVDIWAMGAIMYEMLEGKSCFASDSKKDVVDSVLHSEVTFADDSTTSPEARAIIAACLDRNPSKRPTIQHLLANSWFNANRKVPPGRRGSLDSTFQANLSTAFSEIEREKASNCKEPKTPGRVTRSIDMPYSPLAPTKVLNDSLHKSGGDTTPSTTPTAKAGPNTRLPPIAVPSAPKPAAKSLGLQVALSRAKNPRSELYHEHNAGEASGPVAGTEYIPPGLEVMTKIAHGHARSQTAVHFAIGHSITPTATSRTAKSLDMASKPSSTAGGAGSSGLRTQAVHLEAAVQYVCDSPVPLPNLGATSPLSGEDRRNKPAMSTLRRLISTLKF